MDIELLRESGLTRTDQHGGTDKIKPKQSVKDVRRDQCFEKVRNSSLFRNLHILASPSTQI